MAFNKSNSPAISQLIAEFEIIEGNETVILPGEDDTLLFVRGLKVRQMMLPMIYQSNKIFETDNCDIRVYRLPGLYIVTYNWYDVTFEYIKNIFDSWIHQANDAFVLSSHVNPPTHPSDSEWICEEQKSECRHFIELLPDVYVFYLLYEVPSDADEKNGTIEVMKNYILAVQAQIAEMDAE